MTSPARRLFQGEEVFKCPRHRALFLGKISSFFNNFIFRDYEINIGGHRQLAIDINAVEMVEGKPETILDYLDVVLAPRHNGYLGKARRDDVEDLRQMLINRGAVKASELNLDR